MAETSNCIVSLPVSQLITWCLVIGGWFFVSRQNDNRERRKEVRAGLDKVHQLLEKLEKDSILYHKNQNHDPSLAREIKLGIERIRNKIAHLRIAQPRHSSIIVLRQSITLNNFDSPAHEPQDEGSPIIAKIASAKDSLENQLETAFLNKYDTP